MRYPTIYTAPGDRPKFNFLQTENYLSEFSTEIDKARVRANLGIPDEYTLYWGNMKGNIANQTDLITLLNQVKQGITNTYSPAITTLQANVSSLSTQQVTQGNKIDSFEDTITELQPYLTQLSSISQTLAELRTDIAQNATAISILGGGDSTITGIPEQISIINATLSTVQSNVTANTAKTNTNASNIAALQSQVNINTTNITALQTQLTRIGDLTNLSALTAQVSTNVSNISTLFTQVTTLKASVDSLSDRVTENITDITTNKNQLAILAQSLNSLEATQTVQSNQIATLQQYHNQYDLAAMYSRITTNAENISALQVSIANLPNYTNIISRIANLESKLGEVTLTELTASSTYYSGTTSSDPIDVIITAHYNNGTTSDVTNSVSATSSNTSVAYWNGGRIIIAGAGTATITYSFNNFTATTMVYIESEQQTITIKQYVGYADTYTALLTSQGYNTVKGTWNSSNTPDIHTANVYGFWIITTEAISSVTEVGSYNPSDIQVDTYTDANNNVYKVYLIGPVSSSDLTITIN